MKIKNKKYSFIIDRKCLFYDVNRINLNNVVFQQINVDVGEEIYKGSLFDGTYLVQTNRKLFLITDCLLFCGKNIINKNMDAKLMDVKNYLDKNYNSENENNFIELSVNKLTDLKNAEKLILNDIKKVNKTIPIRGVIFYPEYTNMRLLFLFNNELKNKQNFESKNEIQYEIHSDKPIEAIFEMRRTKIYDVYNLFLISKKNNEDEYKYVKIDIAYIPTIECSKKFRKLTEDKNILVLCKFLPEKNVWLPINEDKNTKYPTDINKLDFVEKII